MHRREKRTSHSGSTASTRNNATASVSTNGKVQECLQRSSWKTLVPPCTKKLNACHLFSGPEYAPQPVSYRAVALAMYNNRDPQFGSVWTSADATKGQPRPVPSGDSSTNPFWLSAKYTRPTIGCKVLQNYRILP